MSRVKLRMLHVLFAMTLLWVPMHAQGQDLAVAEQLRSRGEFSKALSAVDGYLVGNANDRAAHFLRAILLVDLERRPEAMAVYAGLIEDFPDFAEPYNNLAVLLAQNGQIAEAADYVQRAINVDNEYTEAYENLGNFHAYSAGLAFERAVQLADGSERIRRKMRYMRLALSDDVDARQEVTKAIHAWESAWSAQDVTAYLAHYAEDFRPASGISRSAWQQLRRSRLRAPQFIELRLVGLQVERVAADRVEAHFVQHYRSNTHQDVVRKILQLKREGDAWRIIEERSTVLPRAR